MYKLVKLTRLLRVLKIVKEKSKIFKYIQEIFNIGVGMSRLFSFSLFSFIIIHIVGCLWIMTGGNGDGTWMEGDIIAMKSSEKYWTSIYFTV